MFIVIAPSRDGRRLVSLSADSTARVWDAASGRSLVPPMRHSDRVSIASFSPDERWMATASADSTATLGNHGPGRHFRVDRCQTVDTDHTGSIRLRWFSSPIALEKPS